MFRFNRRTAEPLEPLAAPGREKPTSRCQITSSIGTLKSGKPVIPSVPFILCAVHGSMRTRGHYSRLFIPARLSGLTVKQASAIALINRENGVSPLLRTLVALLKAAAPAKLPYLHY